MFYGSIYLFYSLVFHCGEAKNNIHQFWRISTISSSIRFLDGKKSVKIYYLKLICKFFFAIDFFSTRKINFYDMKFHIGIIFFFHLKNTIHDFYTTKNSFTLNLRKKNRLTIFNVQRNVLKKPVLNHMTQTPPQCTIHTLP